MNKLFTDMLENMFQKNLVNQMFWLWFIKLRAQNKFSSESKNIECIT